VADQPDSDAEDVGGSDEPSRAGLLAAGLLGAALGAGLGLLAARAADDERRASLADEAARRTARARRDVGRKAERAARTVRRGSAEAADDASEAIAAAVRALGRTREEFGDRIDRELRALRKVARRQRGWLS
jgi:gas vesicle protein